jgi:hypothetical protein
MAGASTGTGEWVMGPQAAARYHGAMMWLVLVSILAQVVLNTEVMRYTIYTGEPIMTGFMRSKPGPKFWILFYLLLDFGTWFPSLAGLAAQIIVVAVQGLSPTDAIDPNTVRVYSYFVFIICAVLVLFGGKVFNTIQVVLSGKVLFVLFYMVITTVFYVSFDTWVQIWGGLINPFRLPSEGLNWELVSALVGFSGIGGLGNMLASNYVREKDWGMGGKVGAIPSAFGGQHIELSHLGTMARVTQDNLQRFKSWWGTVLTDQYAVWAVGSLFGMMLPCVLGAQYLNVAALDAKTAATWQWAAAMAQDFGAAHGSLFRMLTLICGLVIFIPGQFGVVDGIARRWTDAVWSGTTAARKMEKHKVKYFYYAFAGAYVVWGVAAYTFFPNLSASAMMLIAGNMANFSIAISIIHTLYVNRRFLPPEAQPSIGKQIALVISAAFYLIVFGLVVNQKMLPVFQENLTWTVVGGVVLIVTLVWAAVWSKRGVEGERD